jgi:hypothetical protein
MTDSLAVQVAFRCGSVASIQYFGNGNPGVPKERVEVFSGGVVALIEDFRRLEIVARRNRYRERRRRQEKGHRQELRAFVDLAAGTGRTRTTPSDAFWSSALTLQVPVALGLGLPVDVDLPAPLCEAENDADIP